MPNSKTSVPAATRDFISAFLDPFHRVRGLGHHLSAYLGLLLRILREFPCVMRARRSTIHLILDLEQSRRRLGQRARLLLGAASVPVDGRRQGLFAVWNATSLARSTQLFFLLIVLKMVVETVFVNVLSYMPFVTPFWFVPDELSRLRFFVGQGTRIVAESIGVANTSNLGKS